MRKSNGFTLIEVMVALIIVALGMLSVIRAVNQTVRNTDYLREKTIAHWVAMNKLTETRLSVAPPSNDSTDGDIDMAGIHWHWRMEITQEDPYIQRIEVKVAPKEAGPDASMDTVFGLYGKSFAPGDGGIGWNFNAGPSNSGNSSSASSASNSSAHQPGLLN